ncbi:MAG: nucleotidyltransferase domain-containing protein [Thermoplasmatota archaeon]
MKKKQLKIHQVIHRIRELGESKVKFIILYGSMAAKKENPSSDIDICVYYEAEKTERFHFRMNLLGRLSDEFDITLFQDLPLYVKKEVLKGKVMYENDTRFLYDISRRTYQGYEDFKHRFYDYMKGGIIT